MEIIESLETVGIVSLLINMGMGIALSSAVAWYYARFSEALSNRVRFARLLPLLCLVTMLVISVVKASLALSLGMVGALSIVRFRTAVKDPEELMYLFLAISIGIGLGANQRLVTILAVVVILVLLAGLRLVAPRSGRRNLYVNVLIPQGETQQQMSFEAVNSLLLQMDSSADLRRMDYNQNTLQMSYLLEDRDRASIVTVLDRLRNSIPGISVSFVDQDGLL